MLSSSSPAARVGLNDAGVTWKSSHQPITPGIPRQDTNHLSIKVLDDLTEHISKLMDHEEFACPEEFKLEILWILRTAFDGKKMLSDVLDALKIRRLSLEWLICRVTALHEDSGWSSSKDAEGHSALSSGSQTAVNACAGRDFKCPEETVRLGEKTRFFISPDVYEGAILKRSLLFCRPPRFKDNSGSSTTSRKAYQGSSPSSYYGDQDIAPLQHVTRLKGGLFASPTSDGVIVTDTLTPATAPGLQTHLPYLPRTLILPQERESSNSDGNAILTSRQRKPSQETINLLPHQNSIGLTQRAYRFFQGTLFMVWPLMMLFLSFYVVILLCSVFKRLEPIPQGLQDILSHAGT